MGMEVSVGKTPSGEYNTSDIMSFTKGAIAMSLVHLDIAHSGVNRNSDFK
jgi:hypothetical protein